MNAPKNFWIILAGTAGLALIAFLIYKANTVSVTQAAYTVANQDVRETVLATGAVTSEYDLNLSFKNSGRLDKISAAVGENVKAGARLAILDESDANIAVAKATASLASAEASYTKLAAGSSAEEIAVAQAAVSSAQVALDNAKKNYDIVVSQQNVAVKNAYSALLNSGLTVIPAANNHSTGTVTLSGTYTGAQSGSYTITVFASGINDINFEIKGLEDVPGRVNRGALIPFGTKGLSITFSSSGVFNYNDQWTVAIPDTSAASYVSNYNAYQTALQNQNQAVASASNAISTAQAALNEAQAKLNLQKAPPRAEDIAAAQATIATAKAALDSAQNDYNNNIIFAPLSGTIGSVDAKIGENVAAGRAIITLLNKSLLHVESNISESSIAKVEVGQDVDMTLDALSPDRHFSGKIISIDPASTVVSGVINYRVLSSIPADPNIRPGMSVNMMIVISDKPNVLAVPNRLIRNINGQKVVDVLKNGQAVETEITIGATGDSFTEVTSGLQIGDQIVSSK